MSWRLAIFGIAFSIFFCVGDGLSILSITRKPSSETLGSGEPGTPLLNICFDEDLDSTVPDYDSVSIGVRVTTSPVVDATFFEYRSETPDGTNCKFFEGDLMLYISQEVMFITEVWDTTSSLKDHAEATFTLPDHFIDAGVITSQKVGDTTATVDSLRLEINGEDITGWELCVDGSPAPNVNPICDSFNNVCYFMVVTDGSTYSLCKKSESGTTILKGATLDVTLVSEAEIDPTEVILNYGYDDGTLVKAPVKARMEITSDTPGLEFVPYQTSGEPYADALCISDDGNTCELDYTASTDAMMILIVNNGGTKKSKILTFNDYGIVVDPIVPDIIETHWKRGDEKFYGANIADKEDIGNPTQNSIVDCSKDDPIHDTYCFAYFTSLSPASYFINMQPANDQDLPAFGNDLSEPNELNKITTDLNTLTRAHQSQIIDVILLQDYDHTGDVLKVCYKGSENSSNNTRHEAIIIDENGHWMKIYNPTEGENLTNCYSPADLLTSSLKIAKDSKLTVVVAERELDGYKILTSGKAEIKLTAMRTVNPTDDNGSKGSSSTLAIVGAAIVGIACLIALVAAVVMVVMKNKRGNDGLQYPLHRSNIEDPGIIRGFDNPIPTM